MLKYWQKQSLKITIPTFLLCQVFNLHAQRENIRFRHLTIEDGLSQSTVNCILQDSKGFMWFGTQDGLNKYDGYGFTIYKNDLQNENSISHNFILSIHEDQKGILWIGTNGGGLNRFDPSKETWLRYTHDAEHSNSLSNNFVRFIYEDSADPGILWIATDNGLNKFDCEKKKFTHYKHDSSNPNSLSHNRVTAIFKDEDGTLWLGTDGGLNKFDREKEKFTRFEHDPNNPNSLSHNCVKAIFKDSDGVLWIGTKGGLNKFDHDKEKFTRYKHDPDNPNSLCDNWIRVIYEASTEPGVLWIGTEGEGISKLYQNKRRKVKFINYRKDLREPGSLSNNMINSIYESNDGILWIGTTAGGLSVFDPEEVKFVHYKTNPNNPNSLSHNIVISIHDDKDGRLWIGTAGGGLNIFDRRKEKFIHYKHDPNNPGSLSSDIINLVYEDRNGIFWIGTYNGGFSRFYMDDQKRVRFLHYKHDPDNHNSLSNNSVWSIIEDHLGVFWIGTQEGVDKFDPEKKKFIHYKHDPDNPNSLSNKLVRKIYESPTEPGILWIGTDGGLNKFDPETERFIHYKHDPENLNSLSNNLIFTIYESKSGILWIGTNGGGLNQFDKEKEQFIHFTEKDGLPNNVVYGILEDDDGNLWLSTNKGLSKFNPQTKNFANYDAHDGLQSNEFNRNSYFKSRTGEMFFGGINGFNSFFPDSIRDNPGIPQVVITDFQIFNKSVPIGQMEDGRSILTGSITETREIALSYKDNNFSFEFVALNYLAPEKNQYAYMMEGFDVDWIFSETRRFATYTNLDPGKYVFRVKGSNNDGLWNEEGASLKLTIIPPFWRTWWFYTLFVISIVLMIATIFIYQINRIKRQKEEEERLKVITDVGQVLEHGRATIYRRKINSDVYDYIGNGIKDITGYSTEEYSLAVWKKIVQKIELIGKYSGLTLEEALERMQEGKVDNFVMDFSVRTKSGEIHWVRDITTALRDESGDCNAYFGIMFDITDRKLAEQVLAEKGKSIHRTLLEHTPDPIVIFDKKTHKFLDCNEAALHVYGYSKDEIRSMTPFDLHPPEDIERVEKNIDTKNVDAPNEYKHITKDGRVLDVEVLSDETVYEGKPAWISIVRNITERKRVERELANANKDMEADLNMAREVQMALLSQNYPKNFPKDVPPQKSALQFSHRYIPTSELAGDFFEIIPVSDHEIGILIYDVMGHGVRASLLTAYLHGLVEELIPIANDPVPLMKRLNLGLNAVVTQFYAGMFTTAFYLVADIKTGKMHYTNAGHPYPYIIQRNGNVVQKIPDSEKKPHPALGLFNDYNYTASECSMTDDDIIFFFTDGIYEVEKENKQMFGEGRLIETVKNQLHKTPEKMLDGILDEVNKYAGTNEFIDDVCMVTMHVRQASVLSA